MALRRWGQAMHLVSKNRKIRIWYCWLGYARNAGVIKSAVLVNSIDFYGAKYNASEVFIDLEELEYNTSEENNSAEDVNIIDKSE